MSEELNRMKYTTCFLFITIFLLNHFVGFSQKQKDTTNTYKYYARQQLDTLKKQGAVIILLKSKTRAMEAYEKAGNLKLVNELTEKMNKQNIQMV